jgi:Bacterial TniB protein
MSGEHLSPKTRELLDRPMEERVAHIQKDSWIPYSQASRILQHLEDLLSHPKCDRMPNLAISAQRAYRREAAIRPNRESFTG